MNATTFEKAAVYAVSQDTALLRLQSEYNTLLAQKRFSDARGVALAMPVAWHWRCRSCGGWTCM